MSDMVFDSISRELRSRVDHAHDYAVIENDTLFRTSFSSSWVLESEFRRVEAAREQLLRDYEGMDLMNTFSGTEIETREGQCFAINSQEPLEIARPGRDELKRLLLADLSLVRGIGQKTSHALKRRGFHTLVDLASHRKFGPGARECIRTINGSDPAELTRLVERRYTAGHEKTLATSCMYDHPDLLFLDLETMGFFQRPIILFGIASVEKSAIRISQFLVRDIAEELPALIALRSDLDEDAVLVTFNGKTFDLPYLRGRYAFYGEPPHMKNPHFDILHTARRQWKRVFPDCRLTTLENRLFGIVRDGDIPSSMVPEFYTTYLATGNAGPLVPIVSHNRQDLVTLARLFFHLQEAGLARN